MKINRPLVLLLLAAVLPLLTLSTALGWIALRQEQAAMQQDAQARVRLAATLIERALDTQVAVLNGITRSPRFDRINADDFVALFDRIRQAQPQWVHVTLSDPSGRFLADSPQHGGPHPVLIDPASHQQAAATGKVVVGRVVRNAAGQYGYAIRAPIVRDGQVKGVISAILNPGNIGGLITADTLPRGWRTVVLDSAGAVVGAVGTNASPGSMRASPAALAARRKAPEGIYLGVVPSGLQTVTAYRVLPRYGWSVHVLIPLDIFRAPLKRAIWLVAICGGLSLLCAGLFLVLLAREVRLRQREQAAAERAGRIEALGRMTGGVAHDFNNILMIVQGSADLMKRRAADPERVGALADAILSAAKRGQALTRQLLAFARRSAYEPVLFTLQSRTRELTDLLTQAVGEKVRVEVSIPETLWPVCADVNALDVALINLAVNARDAMEEGGALFVAASNAAFPPGRGREPPLEGDFVALAVRDTGPGVPEANLARIFEPFFTTKAPGKGTGLGLSQVYGFARQSGGAVTVTSRPGHGATFTIYLPRATAQGRPAEPPAPASASGQGRLLIVDDDPEVREAVAAMMEGAGYAVTRAAGAGEALDAVNQGAAVDAVLSDVVMPNGPNGLELAERLQHLRPGLPVVLMTGYSETLSGASLWPVLSKPFTVDEAVAALGLAHRRAA